MRLRTRKSRPSSHHRRLLLDELERREVLATFVVTSNLDTGAGTLRDMIDQANLNPGPDTVEFDGTFNQIVLSSDIVINDPLTITGPGRDLMTLDTMGQTRHLRISIATGGDVTISGMTLTNGGAPAAGGSIASLLTPNHTLTLRDVKLDRNGTIGNTAAGGAVYSLSPIVIEDSVITRNGTNGQNAGGGAISAGYGATIRNSEIVNNRTLGGSSPGGAVAVGYGSVVVEDSLIQQNDTSRPSSPGGAIFASDSVSISRSSVIYNAAHGPASYGGAVYGAEVTIDASRVSGNNTSSAGSQGGAIMSTGDIEITNSTIGRNSTVGFNAAAGAAFAAGTLRVESSTVTENRALQSFHKSGGGLVAEYIELENTIVAGNRDANGEQDILATQTITSSHSLIGTNSGTTLAGAPVGYPDANGNLIGDPANGIIDPRLDTLADNGGPTSTYRLLPGSPAINAGTTSSLMFEQRGMPFLRSRNGAPDMGAYEIQAGPADFGDGFYDCADIDYVVSRVASGILDPTVDFTGDGRLNLDDVLFWLAEAGAAQLASGNPYLLGDANLDGAVDGGDIFIWNNHKFTARAAFCSGDFNADGVVDGVDFTIWNSNKFQEADSIGNQGASAETKLPLQKAAVRVPQAASPSINAWRSTSFVIEDRSDQEQSRVRAQAGMIDAIFAVR